MPCITLLLRELSAGRIALLPVGLDGGHVRMFTVSPYRQWLHMAAGTGFRAAPLHDPQGGRVATRWEPAMPGTCLKIRTQSRGPVSVLALSGELDVTTVGGLTDKAAAALATRPAHWYAVSWA